MLRERPQLVVLEIPRKYLDCELPGLVNAERSAVLDLMDDFVRVRLGDEVV